MFRTLTSRQLVFDVALATVCFAFRMLVGIDDLPLAFVVLAMAVALGLRRASPPLALGIVSAGAIIQVSFGQQPDSSNLAVLPVLFATAAYGSSLVRWLGLIASGTGAVVVAFYLTLPDALAAWFCIVQPKSSCIPGAPQSSWVLVLIIVFFSALATFGLSWTLGLLAKTRRKARNSALARVTADRDRIIAQQDVVVEQERNRIARDMHDVVAHSLAVVIAQADGARYAKAQDPDAVDVALTTIAGTAREALGEVRILLGQLRHSQGSVPQPELADLDRLYEQMRSSGLRLVVSEGGVATPLVVGMQLAVYRIIQEALTNALRHGDTAEEVMVRFEWVEEAVTLSVRNAIPAVTKGVAQTDTSSAPVGHGLAGMRERATLWGGSFAAAGAGERDYLVTATLPIRAFTEADS